MMGLPENRIDVSVIIPTFNRLWCLPGAIESCRSSQCVTEIIVIDDGSTDGTWGWLEKQDGLRIFRQENLGKDWAVNRGFSEALGDFVRFLDSDDLVVEGATDLQLKVARRCAADVVVAGYIEWDEDKGTRRTQEWVRCDDFIAQQLGECDSSHYSAYLFRREFLIDVPHRQEYGVRDDRQLVIEMSIKGPKISEVDIPALIHRKHNSPRLQSQAGLAQASTNWMHWQIYVKAAQRLEARGKFTIRRRKAMTKILWPLAHWIAYTRIDDACELERWIRDLDPAFVPPERGLLGLLYRVLGFRTTEVILKARRMALGLLPSGTARRA